VPGVEADDVLATLAARLSADGSEVLVMSGDRDLFQTTGAGVRVLFLGARGQKPKVIGAAEVEERFQVPPAKLPLYVGLVGDNSDNLPRVPGVGPRTAASWVREFTNGAELLAAAERLEPARLREVLLAHREQVLSNEALATLRRNVPLGEGPLTAPISALAIEQLRALFEQLEFKSLVPRLAAVGP
jgi:DNA polymerase-1